MMNKLRQALIPLAILAAIIYVGSQFKPNDPQPHPADSTRNYR